MLPDATMAAANVLSLTAHAISERERTSDVLTEENSNVDFASMFLSEPVTLGLQKVGFEKPSPIQLKAIPLGRCGLDLIVQAKSGTGKTCVFSVIALEGIDLTNPSTQVLVLAPTREIAVQIQDTIRAIGCEMEGLRCHVFIGGTLFGPDRQKMKKCHIAVGTPGRIKQLIEYEVLKTGAIRLFVLDEADKLLDDTFQEQVNWVYNHLSANKQMLALSATYPEYLAKHLTKYMREPTFVRLNPKDLALRGIKQLYVELEGHSLPNKAFEVKVVKLLKILTQVSFSQCLIFSNLQTRAQNLCDILCDSGWPSECISGAQEQSQRLTAMAKLKKFQCRILISTDLTARGIDAENVNLIINLDIPTDTKTYLHRIGRAGRFGTHGAAISLASKGKEMELLRNIQRQCRVMMTELPDPAPSDLLKQDLSSAGFQHVPIASKSLLPAEKRDPTRNNTTDDHDDSSTSDDALFTSSDVNDEDKQLQKHVNLNETESSIIPPVSDEPSFLQFGINGSNVNTKDDADTSVDSKATKIVESIENQHGITETNRKVLGAPKVDACIQTLPADKLHPKTTAPQFSNVSGNVNHRERRMLPFGFEDAPEVRKLCLPHWMEIKRGDAARRAYTWYEGKESFEKFMKEKTANDGSRMSEKEKGKELLFDTERDSGKADDAALSSSKAEVTSSKDVKANDDPQFKYKDEVHDSSESKTHGSVQTKTSGSTPIQEIERYKALLRKAFVCSLTGEEDTSAETKLGNHEEKIMAVTKAKETDSVESEQVNSICHKQVAKEFEDGQGAKKTECESNLSSEQSFRAAENMVNQRKQETKDEMAEDLKVDSELQHQASTDSLDMQSLNELKTETKSKTSNTTAGKKKVKQQRIRQHVFQMSTAGAFMSPKELDMAIINIPNTSSFDGDVDTTDIDRENIIPLCNKGIRRHKIHHAKDSYKPEQEDALCNRRQEVSNEEVHGAEGSGKETRKNKEGEASVQEKVSKEKESSVSSLNDPVWAIFKNFISSSLPSDVGRKETKPGSEENSLEQSSSSLCESDTSTCSSTSSEDDSSSSETDEEDEDSKEACESESKDEKEENESGIARNGKQHIRPSKAKVGENSNNAETYDGLSEKYHYRKRQNKDGQYPVDQSLKMESHFYQSGFNVEGYEYGGSGENPPYYPAAPVADPRYHGWQYSFNSAQHYPNTYWNDCYNGYTQQPYPGYSYFSSNVPPYI